MTLDTQVSHVELVAYRYLLPNLWAANYLNDLWVFDLQEYKWKQIVLKDNERKPS